MQLCCQCKMAMLLKLVKLSLNCPCLPAAQHLPLRPSWPLKPNLDHMSTQHLSEQEIIRREKLTELNKLGIDAYPAALYPVNTTSVYIKENYKGEENKADFADVCIAGRIMSVRDMGKANFAVLQDATGKIQFYIKQDDICPGEDKTLYQTVWKKLIDIGDIIGVKGYVFTTKTGETSIHVKEFSILTKSFIRCRL